MKKKILVVEDDNTFRKTLIRTLQIEGFETEEAYDGDHAKQMLASKDIDLVISDIRMPKLHGIELLHYINREYDIPVLSLIHI